MAYVPEEDLSERPYSIRFISVDRTQFVLIRGRTLLDEPTCPDALAELIEMMSDVGSLMGH